MTVWGSIGSSTCTTTTNTTIPPLSPYYTSTTTTTILTTITLPPLPALGPWFKCCSSPCCLLYSWFSPSQKGFVSHFPELRLSIGRSICNVRYRNIANSKVCYGRKILRSCQQNNVLPVTATEVAHDLPPLSLPHLLISHYYFRH